MKPIDTIIIILLMAILAISLLFIYEIRSERNQCLVNPLVYGVNSYSQNDKELVCTCSFLNKPSILPFIITSRGINNINTSNS